MLYYLFEYLNHHFDFPGAGVFKYISFRASLAFIASLLFALFIGKRLIVVLQNKQVGETIRDLGLEGEAQKKGTPTMGGLIILAALLLPTVLLARLDNVYIITMIITAVWCGMIGFIDDYIKVFKKDKAGLAGRFKVMGQIGLGLIVGCILYFNQFVVVREKVPAAPIDNLSAFPADFANNPTATYVAKDVKSTITTIPFIKGHEFDYASLLKWTGKNYRDYAWLAFIPIVIFIITAVSNGANITDGIDGLATGTSAIIGSALAVLAYVSGNTVFANYLNILYLPNVGELMVFSGAFIGACVGFLWYNSYPAQVFMGDTGSLALGGIIAAFAISIRKEFLIPILCGIFLIENISVIMQVAYFKYTRKKYGEGRRIFRMSPLHHHYQKLNYHESKIVTRFWIIGIMLAALSVITLKLR
ncbi:MAG TPA: phospho-N-acetylmuramoyl-pentapeptide-transferase [Bacteroidia bacterium]|nr:phospho-N-acetylmuramoyl-pentapeptide-transferase [Bacteroidia bacterium]